MFNYSQRHNFVFLGTKMMTIDKKMKIDELKENNSKIANESLQATPKPLCVPLATS